MAELLIMNVDNIGSTPEKTALLYKRGDVVAVMPDGHQWGAKEAPPKFRIVKLVGSVEAYNHLLEPVYAEDNRSVVSRRKLFIDPSNVVRSR